MMDRHHYEKLLYCHNSAMVRWIAMKFRMLTHFDPLKPSDIQTFPFLKNKYGRQPMPGHVRG